MDEIKENKSTVTTYRVKEDTKADIKKQIEQMGLTQEKYFEKVVSIMELENVKQNNFLSKDTTIIESNLKAILNSFISIAESSNNLISNKDAELEDLKTKYKDMLSTKETKIIEQRTELQSVYAKLDVLQSQVSRSKTDMDELKNEHNKQLEQMESNLKDKSSIIEEYRDKNDMLLNQLKEFEQYPAQLKETQLTISELKDTLKNSEIEVIHLKNELNNSQTHITEQTLELQGVYNELDVLQSEINKYKDELSDSKTKIINMKNELKNKDSEIDSLTNTIELSKEDFNKETAALNSNHQNSIERLQSKYEFEKDKAILDLEKLHQKALNELEANHKKEIEGYQAKYKELLEKLESKPAAKVPKTPKNNKTEDIKEE